jgi:hypothetical protein
MVEFRIRRNPAVTTADLIAMHLKPYNPSHPLPTPTTIPEIEIETPHPRVMRLKFRKGAARRLGKPAYGVLSERECRCPRQAQGKTL